MIRVTCALIVKDNKVLAVQRSSFMDQAEKWEFPGGKMKLGESEEDSVIREVQEELSITIIPMQRLTPVKHQFDANKSIELIPFVCTIKEGDIVLNEHRSMAWLPREQLLQLDWSEADIAIVHEFSNLGKPK